MRVNELRKRPAYYWGAITLGLALALGTGLFVAAGLGQSQVHPLSGRAIAPVMSFHGAPWLERSARHLEEDPERAIELLNLKPGMRVADVGAGSGYFTRRMAPRIVPGGEVYANEIQPEMLEL
jgi:SAM-dependent methyltransferase